MVALHTPTPPAGPSAQEARTAESRAAAQYDAMLVRRFTSGDEAAFTEIVTRYRDKLLHVAFRRLGNQADAEEIVQDTFIRAHRGLAHFRGDCSLVAWLHRIAVNLSCNRHWYFFRRHRHATMSLDASVSESNPAPLEDFLAGDGGSPVQAACLGEFSAIIAECMARLPPSQREVLSLRNVHQHSYRDISRALGIRVGTAKSRIGRARITLRALLDKTYPEFRNQNLWTGFFERAPSSPGRPAGGA